MKADIHPDNYRLVVFEDLNNQESFLTRSTAQTKETVKWQDGKTYPLVKVHITSASHPFYTNQEKVIDVEGRIDKFKARMKIAQANTEKLKAKNIPAKPKKTTKSKPQAADSKSQPDDKAEKPAKAKPSQSRKADQKDKSS